MLNRYKAVAYGPGKFTVKHFKNRSTAEYFAACQYLEGCQSYIKDKKSTALWYLSVIDGQFTYHNLGKWSDGATLDYYAEEDDEV